MKYIIEKMDGYNTIPAFEITYSNGQKTRTEMAKGITLEQAQDYYIGKRFDLGAYPVEDMQTAIKVEQI